MLLQQRERELHAQHAEAQAAYRAKKESLEQLRRGDEPLQVSDRMLADARAAISALRFRSPEAFLGHIKDLQMRQKTQSECLSTATSIPH